MKYLRIFAAISILLLGSCGTDSQIEKNYVVVALPADVESLNPLYSFTYYEGVITELLYLSLVKHDWNSESGMLETSPMLAESYTWSGDSTSIRIKLRKGVKWSDGRPVTSSDIVYSFYLYSHPGVQSRLYGMFKNFYLSENSAIDTAAAFKVEGPASLVIRFRDNSFPTLFDIDVPILPAHIFSKLNPSEIINKEKELPQVTNGAYRLDKWERNQSVNLTRDEASFLVNDESPVKMIFKIVPDYNSRLTQLKNGEVDIMEELRPYDAVSLKESASIDIKPIQGREYDYIGWSNIDMDVYNRTNRRVAHKLFGSPAVRRALTYAVNRAEIVEEYFYNYGIPAAGPVAPMFATFYNKSITPYAFNLDSAKALLKSEGWNDSDKDGVLEKEGTQLTFDLYMPAGNPSRDFASQIIQNNLAAAGIKINIEKLEPGVFFEKMFNREFDAWLAGWSVPIPIELKVYWHSDMEENPLNLTGYSNRRADKILERTALIRDSGEKNKLLYELQEIIHNEEPVTFLYWIDNLAACSKRIKGVNVSPLGSVHHPWEWRTK